MISVILSGLFCLIFGFSLYLRQADIAFLALQILAVYAFCCIIDIATGLVNLGRLLDGSIKGRSIQALTFVGRFFAGYQELLNFRINSDTMPDCAGENIQTRTPQPEKEESLQSFMQESLQELDNAFKPVAAGIIYLDQSSQIITAEHKGFRGRRFEEQLKLIFSEYFNSNQHELFGIHDTLASTFPSEDFSAAGLRFFVSASFSRFAIKGAVFLAFESERRPQASVLEGLEFFAKDLERELGTLNNFHELQTKIEIAEEKSEQRSKFLTEVSHDIRSPLNNVRIILSILKQDLKSVPDGAALIETAVRNCDQADLLLESLMDFAKFRAGKLVAHKSDFNLSEIVENIIKAHSFNASAKGLNLTLAKPDQPVYCHADKTQIIRVINNLLNNAIKYTEAGAVSVSVSTNYQGNCSVRVADSGCGMNKDQIKDLFTPFMRFQSSESNGTGLGLALSKVLLEANAGLLELRSEPGLGSVFVVTLNSAQSNHENLDPKIISKLVQFPQSNNLSLAGLEILLVDDDPDNADSLNKFLTAKGASCSMAFSVKQASECMSEKNFEVIITDCSMPDGGGKQILLCASQLKKKPVVIVVSGDLAQATELIDQGASCAIPKPIDLTQLQEYLQELFFSYKSKVIGA